MKFEEFDGPFNDTEALALRDLFCGERLVIDLIECKRVKFPGEPPPDVSPDEYYSLEPTDESRVWRITYSRPFLIKLFDYAFELKNIPELSLPAQCCFTEKSQWIDEFNYGPQLIEFVPTHYIFNLADRLIEVLADGSPQVERVPT